MIIYTDGACSANGSATAVGGFGIVVLDDDENLLITHHEQVKNTTNNRMELSAILWAMIQYGKELPCPTVYSDSAYCVNTLTSWCWSWRNKGWLKSDNKEPEKLLGSPEDCQPITAMAPCFKLKEVSGIMSSSENSIFTQ